MPYITQEARDKIASGMPPGNGGELNYKMTMRVIKEAQNTIQSHALISDLRQIARDYIHLNGLRYQYVNDIGGALLWAHKEFVRRTGIISYAHSFAEAAGEFYDELAATYEDQKIIENGDCYPPKLLAK